MLFELQVTETSPTFTGRVISCVTEFAESPLANVIVREDFASAISAE